VRDLDRALAARIRLLVLDVDGVLTDGQIVLGRAGEEMKAFSARDGIGIKLAQCAGIEVVFLSARDSAIVRERGRMLGVGEMHLGEQQKLGALRKIAERHAIGLDEIAYVGDDIIDIPPTAAVGLGVAVGDACEDLKEVASHTTDAEGGRGAVRETIEAILKARGDWKAVLEGYLATR